MKRNRYLLPLLLVAVLLCGCGAAALAKQSAEAAAAGGSEVLEAAPSAAPDGTSEAPRFMETKYAEQFTIEYRSDGGAELTVAGKERFLVVPADWGGIAEPGVPVLRKPLAGLYVAASSVMDLILALDALGDVGFTGTTAENWGLPEMREALDKGTLRFAGKYSAPDFELLVSERCPLAVESTMIWHSPDIQEKLEALGIPVLVERSSYEPHPLGRMEWIKVYGLLLDREAEAEAFFDAQAAVMEELHPLPAEEVSAAFFSINAAGGVVVRQPGDYVSKLIALAGGRYVFDSLPGGDTARSTVTIQMERFYEGARDANVLFYNSTIEGELDSLEALLDKSPLLSGFRAVKAGAVWCVSHDMYQKSSAAGEILREMNAILSGTAWEEELRFFRRLSGDTSNRDL